MTRRADERGEAGLRAGRRTILWTGAILLVGLIALGQYVRTKYYVSKIVRSVAVDWATIHTDWLFASAEEIDRQIAAARGAFPFPDDHLPKPASGPLRVLASNPRWFTDGRGRAVYLAGSHTWSDFQDNGHGDPPPTFDYRRFLDFLEAHHHNFFRLWVWENARWALQTPDDGYWFHPGGPFLRSGPGDALDGKPRWDLTRFDQAWFDRLRERVSTAGERGFYVSVMLFQGWSVASRKGDQADHNPWQGHPFNAANNVNGIDGDPNGDGSGIEVHHLGDPRLLRIQEAYVRKVIDTVGDLDNVLYEISNESEGGATEWQYHMIHFIKAYEASRSKQHPVGMTVEYPQGSNEDLFASDADWVSPRDYADPPAANGSKVIVADTDHIFGIGGDREWAWKSFTRGLNLLFMDGYDGAGYGVGGLDFDFDDARWVSLRRNLGYIRAYAERMDLARMTPRPDLCSTGYCLANPSEDSGEYLVYLPAGGDVDVDLASTESPLAVEWFDCATAEVREGGSIPGGQTHSLRSPFMGDAALYLRAATAERFDEATTTTDSASPSIDVHE